MILGDFQIDGMLMPYDKFIARLYNFCLKQDMTPGKIMPSRAYCMDETQGAAVLLLTRQFGTYPFSHGLIGGVVATGFHGAHASHGHDLVILQASHVGFNPETGEYGTYRRNRTIGCKPSANCGKILYILDWYIREYQFACQNVWLEPGNLVTIDKSLLSTSRTEGILLSRLIAYQDEAPQLVRKNSDSHTYVAHERLLRSVGANWPRSTPRPIGKLASGLFRFKRQITTELEGRGHLEQNLFELMPRIVTSKHPALTAAKINTQVEFARACQSILESEVYQGRNLIFFAGLHIDLSPQDGMCFTKINVAPWAALLMRPDGSHEILEQTELNRALLDCNATSPGAISLDKAIDSLQI